MAVIAPFLQRQLYDNTVHEMADGLRPSANLLGSSDSDASERDNKARRGHRWQAEQDGAAREGGLRRGLDALRRRKRQDPSGQDKVSDWLQSSRDWSQQFDRASPTTGRLGLGGWLGGSLGHSSRHHAAAAAGLFGKTVSRAPASRLVVFRDVGSWWLRFNLHGKLESSFPVVSPNTRGRIIWDAVILVLVLYSAVTVPLAFSYGMPRSQALDAVEWTVTALYVVDIGVNFRTAYFDDDGYMVRNSWLVARRYLATWFPLDFLATVPFDAIATASGLGQSQSELTILAVLKTPRLLRLVRLMRVLERLRNANIFKVLQLVLLMLLIAHWLACIWYMIARYSPEQEHWGFDKQQDSRPLTWYLSAFYYSFLLLFGDNISACNNYERVFFIVSLITGACFYSAVVGNMALLVANMNTVATRFRQKLDMTQDALRYMRVPGPYKERVKAFYDYITSFNHPGSEGVAFLSELTKGMNEDVHMFLHSDVLTRVYLFKACEPAFIRSLGLRMKIATFIPGEVIFRQGDLGREMYIIRYGCVAVVSRNNELMSLLQAGDFFGEIALITQARRTAKCAALSNCDLAILSSFDLKALMNEFPDSAHRLQAAARERLRQLQIAGRAGTTADASSDSGSDDEEARRRMDERSLRAKSIARFTTGRSSFTARPQTPPPQPTPPSSLPQQPSTPLPPQEQPRPISPLRPNNRSDGDHSGDEADSRLARFLGSGSGVSSPVGAGGKPHSTAPGSTAMASQLYSPLLPGAMRSSSSTRPAAATGGAKGGRRAAKASPVDGPRSGGADGDDGDGGDGVSVSSITSDDPMLWLLGKDSYKLAAGVGRHGGSGSTGSKGDGSLGGSSGPPGHLRVNSAPRGAADLTSRMAGAGTAGTAGSVARPGPPGASVDGASGGNAAAAAAAAAADAPAGAAPTATVVMVTAAAVTPSRLMKMAPAALPPGAAAPAPAPAPAAAPGPGPVAEGLVYSTSSPRQPGASGPLDAGDAPMAPQSARRRLQSPRTGTSWIWRRQQGLRHAADRRRCPAKSREDGALTRVPSAPAAAGFMACSPSGPFAHPQHQAGAPALGVGRCLPGKSGAWPRPASGPADGSGRPFGSSTRLGQALSGVVAVGEGWPLWDCEQGPERLGLKAPREEPPICEPWFGPADAEDAGAVLSWEPRSPTWLLAASRRSGAAREPSPCSSPRLRDFVGNFPWPQAAAGPVGESIEQGLLPQSQPATTLSLNPHTATASTTTIPVVASTSPASATPASSPSLVSEALPGAASPTLPDLMLSSRRSSTNLAPSSPDGSVTRRGLRKTRSPNVRPDGGGSSMGSELTTGLGREPVAPLSACSSGRSSKAEPAWPQLGSSTSASPRPEGSGSSPAPVSRGRAGLHHSAAPPGPPSAFASALATTAASVAAMCKSLGQAPSQPGGRAVVPNAQGPYCVRAPAPGMQPAANVVHPFAEGPYCVRGAGPAGTTWPLPPASDGDPSTTASVRGPGPWMLQHHDARPSSPGGSIALASVQYVQSVQSVQSGTTSWGGAGGVGTGGAALGASGVPNHESGSKMSYSRQSSGPTFASALIATAANVAALGHGAPAARGPGRGGAASEQPNLFGGQPIGPNARADPWAQSDAAGALALDSPLVGGLGFARSLEASLPEVQGSPIPRRSAAARRAEAGAHTGADAPAAAATAAALRSAMDAFGSPVGGVTPASQQQQQQLFSSLLGGRAAVKWIPDASSADPSYHSTIDGSSRGARRADRVIDLMSTPPAEVDDVLRNEQRSRRTGDGTDPSGNEPASQPIEWIGPIRANMPKFRRERSSATGAPPSQQATWLPRPAGGGGAGSAAPSVQAAELAKLELDLIRREAELHRREADLERREAELARLQAEASRSIADASIRKAELAAQQEESRAVHWVVGNLLARMMELTGKVDELGQRLDDADAAVDRLESQQVEARAETDFLGLDTADSSRAAGVPDIAASVLFLERAALISLERNASVDRRGGAGGGAGAGEGTVAAAGAGSGIDLAGQGPLSPTITGRSGSLTPKFGDGALLGFRSSTDAVGPSEKSVRNGQASRSAKSHLFSLAEVPRSGSSKSLRPSITGDPRVAAARSCRSSVAEDPRFGSLKSRRSFAVDDSTTSSKSRRSSTLTDGVVISKFRRSFAIEDSESFPFGRSRRASTLVESESRGGNTHSCRPSAIEESGPYNSTKSRRASTLAEGSGKPSGLGRSRQASIIGEPSADGGVRKDSDAPPTLPISRANTHSFSFLKQALPGLAPAPADSDPASQPSTSLLRPSSFSAAASSLTLGLSLGFLRTPGAATAVATATPSSSPVELPGAGGGAAAALWRHAASVWSRGRVMGGGTASGGTASGVAQGPPAGQPRPADAAPPSPVEGASQAVPDKGPGCSEIEAAEAQ